MKLSNQIVRQYSESQTKPVLILKMDELCGAICYYFYPCVVSGIFAGKILIEFGDRVKLRLGFIWLGQR